MIPIVAARKEGKYIVYFALMELSDARFNPKPKTIHIRLLKMRFARFPTRKLSM
jgi:hypothetical protein